MRRKVEPAFRAGVVAAVLSGGSTRVAGISYVLLNTGAAKMIRVS
jgi:hypothetical protein